ncbi:MAG: hypothetical protein H7326_03845 [Bdellovibrionaceae bacterium]|nr:hypothetical protein [Pseudobdellovibrionaceae bacterium]
MMKTYKTSAAILLSTLLGANSFAQTSSVRDSSAQAQKDNKKADSTNMIVGALNMGISATYVPGCVSHGKGCVPMAMFMLMGIMNMKQSKANGGAAVEAGGTLGMTDIGMGSTAGYDPTALAAMMRDQEIADGLRFGSSVTNADPATGMSYDPKTNTVTTADGKKYKGSDMTSAASMAAAGLSKSLIDQATEAQKKLEEKANKKMDKYGLNKTVNGEEGGGGGGGGGGSGHGTATAEYQLPVERGAKLGIDRDPAQVAGMQKDFNGEPIGVSGDSIFRMMTRRYKVKESQSSFLDDSALIQK